MLFISLNLSKTAFRDKPASSKCFAQKHGYVYEDGGLDKKAC